MLRLFKTSKAESMIVDNEPFVARKTSANMAKAIVAGAIMVPLWTLLAFGASTAIAKPIPNNSFADRNVGWFDAKGLTCPQICKQNKRQTVIAESEKNTAPPTDISYVCKVRKAQGGPYQWLFGTQFETRPACYTTGLNLNGEYSKIFYCLCVKQKSKIRR